LSKKTKVELFGPEHEFSPAAAGAIESAKVSPPPASPIMGRNSSICFGLAAPDGPFDEVRVGELLSFAKQIGFVVERVVAEREANESGVMTITFGQIDDPRLAMRT
jgi:hypothetical protein